MKKFFIVTFAAMAATTSFAQLSLGVQGTGNLSDAKIESIDGFDFNKKSRVLPGAGLVAEYRFSPHITLRSGINYQQSGSKMETTLPGMDGGIEQIKIVSKGQFDYFQVPVNVLFTTGGSGLKLFAGGGGYFSYAGSGKSKQETTYKFDDGTSETEKEELDPFEKDDEGNSAFKRTDYGVSALAGIKFGNLFANVGYQFSLANISKTEGTKYNNRGLQLTIGYYFFGR
ncbi:MAG TPA: porin family protein [Chitinophagaceae bacterium]|jgi:hypothetical protein|nr:porin family protein [Chitinophagaceae bacterium]